MNNQLIMWEKWVDPFGKNIDEAKWTDYTNDIHSVPTINNEGQRDIDDEYYTEEEEENSYKKMSHEEPIRVIASPLGLIPYNEYTASSKIFNFWLGHCNFNISLKVKETIENTEGVEILDVFTRYRFRIAIGKCFNDADIMSNINTNVYSVL